MPLRAIETGPLISYDYVPGQGAQFLINGSLHRFFTPSLKIRYHRYHLSIRSILIHLARLDLWLGRFTFSA